MSRFRTVAALVGVLAGVLAARAMAQPANPGCDSIDCRNGNVECCAEQYGTLADCLACCDVMWGAYANNWVNCGFDHQSENTDCRNLCN